MNPDPVTTPSMPEILGEFYTMHPGFDIHSTNLLHKETLASLDLLTPEHSAILDGLRTWQRLRRIAPDDGHAMTLYADGVFSAQQVTNLSRSTFIAKYASALGGPEEGPATARQVYDKALQVKDQTMHLLANAHGLLAPYYRNMTVNHIGTGVSEYFESLSDYQKIFGSLNFCSCDECRSIFGAAAYFVDLMRIIDKAITIPNKTKTDPIPAALTLEARRPDLWQIELTCANTTTMIPYLQIVNEILENTAVNIMIKEKPGSDPVVWRAMALSVFPFITPYNLPLHQVRILLRQFQLDLHGVIAVFDPKSVSPLGLSVEWLGLSYEGYRLVTTPAATAAALSLAFGTPVGENDNGGLDRLSTMLTQTALERGNFLSLLRQGLSSEERSGVTYTYIPTQFGTRLMLVFNGDQVTGSYDYFYGTLQGTMNNNVLTGAWSEASLDPPDNEGRFEFTFTADLSSFTGKWMKGYDSTWEPTPWNGAQSGGVQAATLAHLLFINQGLPGNAFMDITVNKINPLDPYEQITPMNHDTLDRINRFVRLAVSMDWDYATLDWVMISLGCTEINDNTIIALAGVKEMADRLAISPITLSACWFDLKTTGMGDGDSSQAPFDTIFNDPALIRNGPTLDYYHPVTTTSGVDQNALFNNPLYLSLPADWIVSQLPYDRTTGVKRDMILPSPFPGAADPTSLTYGRRILSGIKATNNDLTAIAEFFFPGKTIISLGVSTLSLLYRHVMLPAELGMSVTDYLVLLRLAGKQQDSLMPVRDIKWIADISDWMKKAGFNVYELDYILNGTTSLYVNTGYTKDSLAAFLQSLILSIQPRLSVSASFVSNSINADVSAGFFNYFQLAANGFINADGVVLQMLTDAEKDKITQLLLPDGTTIETTADQRDDAQKKINQLYADQQQLLNTGLSGFFNNSSELTNTLLQGIGGIQHIPSILAMFIADNGKDDKPIRDFILMFAQHLLMARRISLTPAELDNVYHYPQAYLGGSGDLFNFTPLLLSNLQNIWKMKFLVTSFQDTKDQFISFLAAASAGGVTSKEMDELCALTGWHPDQCRYVCDILFGAKEMCKTVEEIDEVNSCFVQGRQAGLDMYFLHSLAALQLLPVDVPDNWATYTDRASVLTGALRAHFGDTAWNAVFKNFNSPLLEQQRDVLEAFCLWKLRKDYKDMTSSRNLYEFLLIDVDMSGCSEISYIRQALNSAQLYLQRCRLNLEINVSISKDDIPDSWWPWLLSYRLWEANRQIFLYPENYLDPLLRKTKTSLFRQLENDLSQGDVDKVSAGKAYRKYLDSFSALAKLQYVDACQYTVHDPSLGATDTLFLFARTQTDPAKFYYITRMPGEIWSEWKEIGVTIPSMCISPVYVFGRLFIFWSELYSAQDNDPTATGQNAQCTIVKASIRYTFIDFSGNWTQPQSLVDNRVVNIISHTDLHQPFDPALFGLDKPYWQKVAVTPVQEDNFTVASAGRLSGEKLVLSYGPFLQVAAGTNPLVAPNPPAVNNPDFLSFEDSIAEAVSNYNQELAAAANGQLPLNASVVIDEMLNPSWLIGQNEFIYLADDVFGADTTPAFQAGFDSVSGALVLLPAANTIANNYTEGMRLQPMVASAPAKANTQCFVWAAGGITVADSIAYYTALVNAKLIGSDGTVSPDIVNYTVQAINTLLGINDLIRSRYVLDMLFNLCFGSPVLLGTPQGAGIGVLPVRNTPGSFLFLHPSGTFLLETTGVPGITEVLQVATAFGWVASQAFINAGLAIDPAKSASIYAGLQTETIGLVAATGIVDLDLASHVQPGMIAGLLLITLQQAQWVLNVLLSSGRTRMQYDSHTVDGNLNDNTMKFTSTRLTTGAVQDLSRRLFAAGIDGLLQISAQQAPVNIGHCFGDFQPGSQLAPPEAFYDNQVAFSGPYGYYYWELFYYAPAMVASLLNTNRQYSDAEQWYQYIFNPTIPPLSLNPDSFINKDITRTRSEQFFVLLDTAKYLSQGSVTDLGNLATVEAIAAVLDLNLHLDPTGVNLRIAREMQNMLRNNFLTTPLSRYWQFDPFRNHTIESLVKDLQNPTQIKTYNDDPFDPDAIARLRIGAYEKNVVMRYIDNLLNWGDMEFTQYTWETITTATMLYVYAYDLLGPRPQDLGACSHQPAANFADILLHYKGGDIPQFLIDLENTAGGVMPVPMGTPGIAYNDLDVYFCIPDNSQFMGYWDLVEDRLYKIRHCLNIDGQPQPLPLFDPLIDPMQLVKAAAARNGVLSVGDLFPPPVPYYRFNSMLARTYNIISSVIQLGGSLLTALEKNDTEALVLLNATQQLALLNMMTVMKQQQIEEQGNTISALNEGLLSARNRETYYSQLLSKGLNNHESTALLLSAESLSPTALGMGIRGIAIAGYLLPDIFGFADGGMQFGDAINMGAQISDTAAAMLNQSASVLATMAQYVRRSEEWTLQQQMAGYDVQQISWQIAAAQVQLAYNRQDLAVHQKNIEQSGKVEAFLRSKFTNQELYQWMISRLSTLYYNAYQLAINVALAAQTAYQYELGSSDSFITYSYWDNLRKGLLAGEGLMLSVQQMEMAYLNKNQRCLEIQKTLSLRQAFPQEFLKFVWGQDNGQQGIFNFTLSERLFDFDYPGHYCRKIKTLSISLPAVIGPYQNLNATLTQGSNFVLLKADANDTSPVNYLIYTTSPDWDGPVPARPSSDVLRSNWMPNQQIAVTTGLDDTGLFQMDFNDERYLPFEGTGAVSSWTFNLPPETNRINFDSISDLIIKISYTAIDGGSPFASKVKALYSGAQPQYRNLKAKCMDMNQTYGDAWYRMFITPPAADLQSISFRVTDNYLLTTLKNIRLHAILIQIQALNDAVVNGGKGEEFVSLTIGTGNPSPIAIADNFGELEPGITGDGSELTWIFSFTISKTPAVLLNDDPVNKSLDPKKFLNMALAVVYQANAF